MIPERLVGERIVLARHAIGRSMDACEAIEESVAELEPWQPWVTKFAGVQSCLEYSKWVEPKWGARFDYQILDRATSRFLGQANLEEYKPEVPSIQIGYWLRSSATGHGYASEAAALLLRAAFECLGVARFELICDERNARSAAVARRLGLTLEGVMRNERRDTYGSLQNTMLWSMTDIEFSERLHAGMIRAES